MKKAILEAYVFVSKLKRFINNLFNLKTNKQLYLYIKGL